MNARHRIESVVTATSGLAVTRCSSLRGGDVAQSFRVELADGRVVFARTHDDPPQGFFTTEASGLAWLRKSGSVRVPGIIAVSDDPPALVLEWIDEGSQATPEGEAAFGRALAAMHRAGAPCFGREDRRTTGSRRMPNEPTSIWVEFYATQRLLPLARLASDSEAMDRRSIATLERVATKLVRLGGPPEVPARLHGDLWAGNRLIDRDSQSWLIDPAAHGGHREFDLAMMRLFGGFDEAVFAAYDEVFPLADGWAERVPLHQLAPLVVHAIKFGGSYAAAVDHALGSLR